MKKNVLILSNYIPGSKLYFEDWLFQELKITYNEYSKILIIPSTYTVESIDLPINCEVLNINDNSQINLSLSEIVNVFRIVISDFNSYPNKIGYLKLFGYNLSLVKKLHIRAKEIGSLSNWFNSECIVYAYWAGDLATTACIIKQMYHNCKVVTRGHGFEIFEDQTRNGVIPFRKYQYKFLDKLYADSKRGFAYLNKKNKNSINSYSYVGTKNLGMSIFNEDLTFTVATCSIIRDIKRLHLMSDILSEITFPLVWHVLGDGPDLELVKKANAKLPQNIIVNYHGRKNSDEILTFYKNNHINLFASLSYSEGLPVSMMEAQSFGIPIMSTDVGGCNEICNEETGFLIPKDFNGIDVANKIQEFKYSNKNTQEFRVQCRDYWLKNFNSQENYLKFSESITSLYS